MASLGCNRCGAVLSAGKAAERHGQARRYRPEVKGSAAPDGCLQTPAVAGLQNLCRRNVMQSAEPPAPSMWPTE